MKSSKSNKSSFISFLPIQNLEIITVFVILYGETIILFIIF